jgi:hypothetical protein
VQREIRAGARAGVAQRLAHCCLSPFTFLTTLKHITVLSLTVRTHIYLCPQGQLSVMAAQSVYDTSMPRPSRNMVRGEILPSAWILQPVTIEGKEITRVIFLAQVIWPLQAASQCTWDLYSCAIPFSGQALWPESQTQACWTRSRGTRERNEIVYQPF